MWWLLVRLHKLGLIHRCQREPTGVVVLRQERRQLRVVSVDVCLHVGSSERHCRPVPESRDCRHNHLRGRSCPCDELEQQRHVGLRLQHRVTTALVFQQVEVVRSC